MTQPILYFIKIVLAVILILISLLFTVLILVYLFTEFKIDDPENYELIPFFIALIVIIYSALYHFRTFYLVSKTPRGETFKFKEVKNIYWYSPWAFCGLIWFVLVMVVVDELSVGSTFDLIDWIIFGILFFISILTTLEVLSLKKVYKQRSIDYTAILDQIGQE